MIVLQDFDIYFFFFSFQENSMRFNTADKMEVSFSGTIKAVNPVKESD